MRTVYSIKNFSGDVIAEHVRVDLPGGKKNVYWQIPGGDPRDGLMGIGVADLPLYGSERLADLEAGRTVLVTEGEKARDALVSMGFEAVATVTGASSAPGEDALAVLLPFDVVTWEDHDTAGERHMRRTVAGLVRLGGSARRIQWGREKGDDAADCQQECSVGYVQLLVRAAQPWDEQALAGETDGPRPIRPTYDRAGSDWRVQTARAKLTDVAQDRLGPPKKRDGRSLFWHCPFHGGDREPSFKVDLREPFFRCFGCDARGDVFDLLRRLDGADFRTVLRDLAPEKLLGAVIPW